MCGGVEVEVERAERPAELPWCGSDGYEALGSTDCSTRRGQTHDMGLGRQCTDLVMYVVWFS